MTIIDWMNQLLVHKKPWSEFSEDEQKKFSPFIINRWLSMDKEFIEIVNVFQKYAIGTLESREVYKWYCNVLPRGKRFNKYIKSKLNKKYDKELVNIITNHFECSKLQVQEYLELIDREELKSILEMYGLDKKTMKRLCK
jgi:hypothetical protein|tara:strand:+ start:349 stop:768 length:420 start_codon:yes stop_codon:yes gene_type:complete